MDLPTCLIANRFLVKCKEKPSIVKRENPRRHIVKLKKSAHCEISRECDENKESVVIKRFRRAFDVKLLRGDKIIENAGTLKCDYCESPNIHQGHRGHHYIEPFLLDRIKEKPTTCIRDEEISNRCYAEINPEFSLS